MKQLMNDIRIDLPKEGVMELPINTLSDFENHPFRVVQDDELLQIVESIKESGVLQPAIARSYQGKTELISGHRRKLACQLLGIKTMPVIIREFTDDEAIIAMVNSNLQRENILPSEKAFAYKMKMDALKHQGKATLSQVATKSGKKDSAAIIGEQSNESRDTVFRYIRLTNLLPQLLEQVDSKEIAFSPAVELSYLAQEEQLLLLDSMDTYACTPSHAQAIRLKKLSQDAPLTEAAIDEVLAEEKANQVEKFKFPKNELRKYFPKSYTDKQIYDAVFKALELMKKQRDRNKDAR